ncbi:TlpA disulfide reductase family protein [Allotamlana fucoidanivorans]|uniref:AhpC/TSA family protein n=2 Tax=Allotamlana fucoidanivorans TaxID=2583814 RepID=A0A5C4SRD5_9FLAO|nr:TlpA disulfide reductase family protein [Tamlana fucoidanivorans]TNJ46960.1 AhpC/TSA family protein [Tamlana fucoidanivorans]
MKNQAKNLRTIMAYIPLFAMVFLLLMCKNEPKEIEEVEPTTYSIEGTISGLGNNYLYYRVPNKDYDGLGYNMDSLAVTDGNFKLTDSIEGYHYVSFYTRMDELIKKTPMGYYPAKSGYLNTILYPGAEIKVSGKVSDFMEAYPENSDDVNNELGKLHQEIYPLMNESVNYLVKSTYEASEEVKKSLETKADSVSAIVNDLKQKFVLNNPSSVAGLFYLSDMMMRSQIEDETAINAFNNLDSSLADVSFYKDVSYRVNAINSTKAGALSPAIKTTSTLDGNEFDLSSFRGKYVMIDFWGIWCGPCVSEMPKVKEYYEKYNDRLEILGVNSGDKKQRIIDFIERNDYDWQQIMDVRDSELDNFVLRYNVSAFPTKFIIDPEGKIIKKYVGSGEEAFELLDELLI